MPTDSGKARLTARENCKMVNKILKDDEITCMEIKCNDK